MRSEIKITCALVFLGASVALAQGTPAGGQATGATPAATTGNTANAPALSSTAAATAKGDPAAEATIQKMEQELAEGNKAHDTAPFEKYIDDNIVAYGPGWKANGKAEVLQGVKSSPCTINTVALSDFAYKWISPDAVLMTYLATANATCQGKTTDDKAYTSSLWHKTGGHWLTLFHQETAIEPVTAPAPARS